MSDFLYRPGTKADIPQMQKLGLDSYGQFSDVLGSEAWEKMAVTCGAKETYSDLLKVAKSFVCEHQNQIVGMAFLIPSGTPFRFFEADWSYIRMVGVDPNFSGKGIGRKLTEMCVREAKSSGEKIIALHTSEFQNAARHIYESLGFKKIKTLDPIYDKTYWLYHLELEKSELHYARATFEDVNDLVDLRLAFFVEMIGDQPEEKKAVLQTSLQSYFQRVLEDGSAVWLFAKHKNVTVGVGGLIFREHPGSFLNPDGKWAYIINMYTVPEFRKKGICAKILSLLTEEAKSKGVFNFELHATPKGEKVYVQNGFTLYPEPTYRKHVDGE